MVNSSHNAINNLNETTGSFKSEVDVEIDSVNTSTASIQATTDKIYDSISKFKQDMTQNEQKQFAHENILRTDQVLKEQFGDHEVTQKTVIGVVKDFDTNLVRNGTIQEISGELWTTSSRYWLSYALMVVTVWVNDYKEVGNNALAGCVRRDPVKASLFSCLLNLRFGRSEVSSLWFSEYSKTLDPAVMQQEPAVLLQAYLNGLFGTNKELEHNANHIVKSWITELNAHQDIVGKPVRIYQKYIQLFPAVKECHYQTLQDYCDTYENLKQSYANASKYDKLIAYIDLMDAELEEQAEGNYKGRVDSILLNLVSNYDSKELELKNQQAYFNFIIENGGLMDTVKRQFEEYQNVKSENPDTGKQVIQRAVYDDVDQTDIHVKKFGLQNTKEWFKGAAENWAMVLQETLLLNFPLHIDTWSGVSDGEDQVSLMENMRTYYDNNKFQIMYVNTVDIAAIIVAILSLGLIFVTPYSLAATAIALGLLVFRTIKANKESLQRVNHSVECSDVCMMELADFKQFYLGNKDKKAKLLSDVGFL